jgi:DNA replication protein
MTCLLLVALTATAAVSVGWGKKERSNEDLIQIAAAGGGLVLDANGRDVAGLMQIAAISRKRESTLYLKNCGGMNTADLMNIAAAGSGHVVFEF